MSSLHPAIRVSHLGKKYTIGGPQEKYLTFRDAIVNSVKAPFRRFSSHEPPQEFWALKDVSFDVEQGEVVGIIGRNGAGKSTLLKILSRITSPTEGTVDLYGRVGSLLEVGTGFHPELTGRENIFLSGSILGMKHREIDAKLDEIVKFSEIEKFLDTPAKRYSSGMYVRLAFAVAAHLEPEILLVDEVLAVGDAAFQKKCIGKMGEVAKEGRTILFVSHNMGAIKNLCQKTILLNDGKIVTYSDSDFAIQTYYDNIRKNQPIDSHLFSGTLTSKIKFLQLKINSKDSSETITISPDLPVEIVAAGESKEDVPDFRFTFAVFCEGIRLLSQHDVQKPALLPKGSFLSKIVIPKGILRPGEYSVALGGYRDGMTEWIWGTDLGVFWVSEEWGAGNDQKNHGFINIPFNGERRILS
jgi:lipopolysaccharide transport system ATP-binding protein